MTRNVINIVNFVRGCDYRADFDLLTPVVREIEINKQYGFKNTFLLQYDAMSRDDMVELFKREKDGNTELGVWFEMGRGLTEAVGIPWRGREGYDWDWYVDPGFLEAYTTEQREMLIDEVFRLFKELFGHYPRVAGSWLLDAYSMAYMSDKYGMDAFCICREQYAVDAYTLWGGYYSGGYYPSRNNMLCPSQSDGTKINTPVFRMLGIDPIYGYDEQKHSPRLKGCYTMEPVWQCGKSRAVMEWYFNEYYSHSLLAGGHATTGQENSFGWKKAEEGYRLQAELIARLASEGKVRVETLGESGVDFARRYKKTPASVLAALGDWSDNGIQSVWYSCVNWRANLFLKNSTLIFRDINKFDDRYEGRYLHTVCREKDAVYDNLPVVDNRIYSSEDEECAWRFADDVICIESLEAPAPDTLSVKIKFADGHIGAVTFDENSMHMRDCGKIKINFGSSKVFIGATENSFEFSHGGIGYSVLFDSNILRSEYGFEAEPVNGQLTVIMF